MFLGVPFNIASYALLLIMIAQEANMVPCELVHTIGDAHIYLNHRDQVRVQSRRTPKELPTIKLSKKSIWDMTYDDIELIGYKPHTTIKAPIAI